MAIRHGIMVCVGLVCVGCTIRLDTPGGAPSGTLAVRIAANAHDHEPMIQRARSTKDNSVVENGRVVAEWLPLWPGGRAEKELPESEDVISRETPEGREVLVIHGPSDITEQEMTRARYAEDVQRHHSVYVELTKKGSDSLASLTLANLPDSTIGVHRRAAMIVNGRVYSLPQIEVVVCNRFAIDAVSEKEAEQLESILNGLSAPETGGVAQ